MVVLEADQLKLSFGGIHALSDVGLTVREGEIVALIGPNGAGKTSLLNCINGFYHPDSGTISFMGENLGRQPPHRRAAMGIGRTFQSTALYHGMTVLDNIFAGRHVHMRANVLTAALRWPWGLREELHHRERVEEIIDFLELQRFRNAVVGSLSYGLRKRIDLGRALAMDPKLLLVDEPMAGMNLEEKEDMARFILDIHEINRIPIVLVEHDMGVVMDIATRIVVLDWGRLIADGPPEEIAVDPVVVEAYLGQVHHPATQK